jgi:hypothetical protein
MKNLKRHLKICRKDYKMIIILTIALIISAAINYNQAMIAIQEKTELYSNWIEVKNLLSNTSNRVGAAEKALNELYDKSDKTFIPENYTKAVKHVDCYFDEKDGLCVKKHYHLKYDL